MPATWTSRGWGIPRRHAGLVGGGYAGAAASSARRRRRLFQ